MAASTADLMALSQSLPFSCRKPAPSAASLCYYSSPRSSLLAASAPNKHSQLFASSSSSFIRRFASSRQRCPSRIAPSTGFLVSASFATVVDVAPAAKELYYNVVLNTASNEQILAGYTTPGQYVALQLVNTSANPAYMFMASAPKAAGSIVEFLVRDTDPGTTAHQLVNSTRGDKVELSQVIGDGFAVNKLYPPHEVETVLLFASGYGLGPVRALIEAGFQANIRRDVRLYPFFATPDHQAYAGKYDEWRTSGVKVLPVLTGKKTVRAQDVWGPQLNIHDPSKTCAVLCGSTRLQERVTQLLLKEGVPLENILTVFEGYTEDAYNKLLATSGEHHEFLKRAGHYREFLEMAGKYSDLEVELVA